MIAVICGAKPSPKKGGAVCGNCDREYYLKEKGYSFTLVSCPGCNPMIVWKTLRDDSFFVLSNGVKAYLP